MPCTRTGIPLRFIPTGEGRVRIREIGAAAYAQEMAEKKAHSLPR